MQPQLTHVGIYTRQLAAMERFYTSIFGLVVTDRGTLKRLENLNVVFLSGDVDSHHQLVLIECPSNRPESESTIHQLSFKVGGLGELRRLAEAVKQAGVAPLNPIDHGNAWSVYSADPDGNGIEIYLDTDWYVAQPHSRPLALDASDDEVRRTTEAAVKADPTWSTRAAWQEKLAARLAHSKEEHSA